MVSLLHHIEWILFLYLGISTGYILLFALLGCFGREEEEFDVETQYDIAVLIKGTLTPEEWNSLIHSYLHQTYSAERFTLFIATSAPEEELRFITQEKVTLLSVEEGASDGKILRMAFPYLQDKEYDLILVTDAWTHASESLLAEINTGYNGSSAVMQLHRVYENRKPYATMWSAVSEEIRRSVASRGHNKWGMSASLEESGYVIEFGWLEDNLEELPESFTHTQLELYLLRDREFIDFQEDIHLISRKETRAIPFHQKQRRSFGAQCINWLRSLTFLPEGIFGLNPDLLDRPIQWLMLPPIWMIHLIGLMGIVTTYLEWMLSPKWWGLLFVLLFALALATPNYLVDKPFNKAMKRIPLYLPGWLISFFKRQTV